MACPWFMENFKNFPPFFFKCCEPTLLTCRIVLMPFGPRNFFIHLIWLDFFSPWYKSFGMGGKIYSELTKKFGRIYFKLNLFNLKVSPFLLSWIIWIFVSLLAIFGDMERWFVVEFFQKMEYNRNRMKTRRNHKWLQMFTFHLYTLDTICESLMKV